MTPKQALKQAQARWGSDAAVDQIAKTFYVGVIRMGLMFDRMGEGRSWEHALLDADNKKREGRSTAMGMPR